MGELRLAASSPVAPSSTSPSTATTAPSGCDDQRVDVDAGDVGVARQPVAPARRARRRVARDRRPPRRGTRPSSFCVARSSIISAAVTASNGAGRNTTSATASARMPPTPSITVGPNWGSRTTPAINSRLPETIGATSTVDVTVVGRGGGEQFGWPPPRPRHDRRGGASRDRARSCGRSRRRSACDDRIAEFVGGSTRCVGVGTNRSAATGRRTRRAAPWIASDSVVCASVQRVSSVGSPCDPRYSRPIGWSGQSDERFGRGCRLDRLRRLPDHVGHQRRIGRTR